MINPPTNSSGTAVASGVNTMTLNYSNDEDNEKKFRTKLGKVRTKFGTREPTPPQAQPHAAAQLGILLDGP